MIEYDKTVGLSWCEVPAQESDQACTVSRTATRPSSGLYSHLPLQLPRERAPGSLDTGSKYQTIVPIVPVYGRIKFTLPVFRAFTKLMRTERLIRNTRDRSNQFWKGNGAWGVCILKFNLQACGTVKQLDLTVSHRLGWGSWSETIRQTPLEYWIALGSYRIAFFLFVYLPI